MQYVEGCYGNKKKVGWRLKQYGTEETFDCGLDEKDASKAQRDGGVLTGRAGRWGP